MDNIEVYGLGQPLMDILVRVDDDDIVRLGLNKGIMHLIDRNARHKLISYFESSEKELICGGDVSNTIIALSSLGIKTAFSGKVGEDDFGEAYLSRMIKHNVSSRITKINQPTGVSIVMITPDSERTMNTHLGASKFMKKEDIDEDGIRESKFLYLTGYMWNLEEQKQAMIRAIELAKKYHKKIIFDVADPFVVRKNKDDFKKLITDSVNIVFANEEEAAMLSDGLRPEDAAVYLSSMCKTAVVKVGSKGAYVKKAGEPLHKIPVNKVNAVDTTGAGDMFAAGFIYGLCKGMGTKDSGTLASYLACQVVQQRGAQFSDTKSKRITAQVKKENWNLLI